MNFSIKMGDLEVRSCNKRLITSNEGHDRAEIVQWLNNETKPACYTIAYWGVEDEKYDLRFVGNRPFDEKIDILVFMRLAKMGQDLLEMNHIEKLKFVEEAELD